MSFVIGPRVSFGALRAKSNGLQCKKEFKIYPRAHDMDFKIQFFRNKFEICLRYALFFFSRLLRNNCEFYLVFILCFILLF